jgi:hypothetical protein
MSVLVHVHRSADWFDSDYAPIERWEWELHAAQTEDLEIDDDGTITWVRPDGEALELTWLDGRIVVENRDRTTRARLALLAADLGAILQGDDCELYGPDGNVLDPEAGAALVRSQSAARFTTTVSDDERDERLWDPDRPRSRAEFLKGFLRRD